jgi:hypothetical protein
LQCGNPAAAVAFHGPGGQRASKLADRAPQGGPCARRGIGRAFSPNCSRLADTTWAHRVANAVILQSPLPVYAARPVNMLANSAPDPLNAIPSYWNETVVLPVSEIQQPGPCTLLSPPSSAADRSGKPGAPPVTRRR